MDSYAQYTDPELLDFLKTGEGKGAFDEIYGRYWKKLYNEAFKRLKDGPQCEEIVQDVLTDLWMKRHARQIDHLQAYLLRSVRYQMFMLYKKNASLPAFEEPLEHMHRDGASTDEGLYLKDLRQFIDQWLLTQPEKRREIFRLRHFEELGTREIAELLGISQKTVQNQLLSAVNDLKGKVDKNFILLLASVLLH
ncbi:RNA polymerase sigma-70 factor, ECF subfamily [bacterium A37T11]|nr:RNA polymerase sigma-70 factor, ECF subfamily [bacterium A37T11]